MTGKGGKWGQEGQNEMQLPLGLACKLFGPALGWPDCNHAAGGDSPIFLLSYDDVSFIVKHCFYDLIKGRKHVTEDLVGPRSNQARPVSGGKKE